MARLFIVTLPLLLQPRRHIINGRLHGRRFAEIHQVFHLINFIHIHFKVGWEHGGETAIALIELLSALKIGDTSHAV